MSGVDPSDERGIPWDETARPEPCPWYTDGQHRGCENAHGAARPAETTRCAGRCHCHAGSDGLMHPPCCGGCAPRQTDRYEEGRRAGIEEALRAVAAEPELDGPIIPGVLEALTTRPEHVLRAAVVTTKQGIADRIRALSAPAAPETATTPAPAAEIPGNERGMKFITPPAAETETTPVTCIDCGHDEGRHNSPIANGCCEGEWDRCGCRRFAAPAPPAASATPDPDERGPMTWGVSTDEESFHGHYASKEEALANAVADLDLQPGQRFWVGGGRLWRPHQPYPADRIVEFLCECAGDECGEIAEDWPSPSQDEADALEAEVHAVVLGWLKRIRQLPDFYCCEVTEKHEAPALAAPAAREKGDDR